MVASKINPQVNYLETKALMPQDKQQEVQLYQTDIHGHRVVIAIGQPQHTPLDKQLVFFPIYLIKPNYKALQIGVFEQLVGSLDEIMNEVGTVDVDQLQGDPLLYAFATESFVRQMGIVTDDNVEDEDAINNADTEEAVAEDAAIQRDPDKLIAPHRQKYFTLDLHVPVPRPLKTESARSAKDIREKYHESAQDDWINRFMKNPHYGLVDNEGQGDCLFACIRDAFASIGEITSVAILRQLVSAHITQANFDAYQTLFHQFQQVLNRTKAESIVLKKKGESLKTQKAETIDKATLQAILKEAADTAKAFKAVKEENKEAKALMEEVAFMKGIPDLITLRQFIMTPAYWADNVAIQILERLLQIKLVILSSDRYEQGDLDHVLSCGSETDPLLQGSFTPDYYILLDHNGQHYKLITYQDSERKKDKAMATVHSIFTFSEIPYDLKRMVVNKCMERHSGTYSLIPEFQQFQHQLHPQTGGAHAEMGPATLMGLFDELIVLSFYNHSSEDPPGKGPGETMPLTMMHEFAHLASIEHWRRKLDDDWVQPFGLDNHQWGSVTHYYQASKFQKENPEFYLSFTLGSGTELSKNAAMARGAGGQTGKHNGTQIRPLNVVLDPTFYNSHKGVKNKARKAKFEQNPDLLDALVSTHRAKLMHHVRGDWSKVADGLMVLRNEFTQKK